MASPSQVGSPKTVFSPMVTASGLRGGRSRPSQAGKPVRVEYGMEGRDNRQADSTARKERHGGLAARRLAVESPESDGLEDSGSLELGKGAVGYLTASSLQRMAV